LRLPSPTALVVARRQARASDFLAYAASDGGSNAWDASRLWNEDTTWAAASPWA